MAYIDPAGNAFNDISSEAEIYLNDGNDSVDIINNVESFAYGGNGDDGVFYDGLAFAHLYGGQGNDYLAGGGNGDFLYGEDGVDLLQAGSGNDLLEGGAGSDRLLAGAGRDRQIGGSGADTFEFHDAFESTRSTGRDVIRDFSTREGDQIHLSILDADPFTLELDHFKFIGSKGFADYHRRHPGDDSMLLRFDPRSHTLQGDTNHNFRLDSQDFVVKLVGVSHLNADDLILV